MGGKYILEITLWEDNPGKIWGRRRYVGGRLSSEVLHTEEDQGFMQNKNFCQSQIFGGHMDVNC